MAGTRSKTDHIRMMTCGLCGGSITTCASCHGSCSNPVCHVCRDSDASVAHGLAGSGRTLTLSSPVVLV
jgi:hypothetical protein